MTLLGIATLVLAGIGGHVMLRAITAKIVTGKWPHQSKLSEEIYRSLP